MKILVADDGPVSLRMMERMLLQNGYEVIAVQDGEQAARILCEPSGPRLALIDWMMPGLDGPGVCRRVRSSRQGAYVYIALLTAKQSREAIVQGLKAGADDYLTKPCHPAELEARLHAAKRIVHLEDKLVEAREQMRFKATHDALTSLWDRGAILALLRSELSRSIRDQTPVSLLLCDIDHFKNINDFYGHIVGDEILQGVSERLQQAVRMHDAVGRYGGEEFLVLLNGCPASDLSCRAEEVRTAISEIPFRTESGAISLSLSIGAITVENWRPSLQIEQFLKEADAALYRAKAAGRDQVAYAEMPAAVVLALAHAGRP
jgi:diguanylate cyclase (GGDEF)-like protein